METTNGLFSFVFFKFIKSDQEKKDIARQVLSATKKATKNVRQLKQENSAFQLTIQVRNRKKTT